MFKFLIIKNGEEDDSNLEFFFGTRYEEYIGFTLITVMIPFV